MQPQPANLSDSERKAYETYILASSDEARQEAINKLVPGSPLYYNLYFLDRFRVKGGDKFSQNEQEMFRIFQQKYYHTPEYKQIEARWKLLQYDASTTAEEKQQILKDIDSTYLHLTFDHYKPEDQFKSGGLDSESASESEELSVFSSGLKKTSVFNHDEHFSKAKAMELCLGNIDNENVSNSAIQRMAPGFEHEIDFTKYHYRSVYYAYAVNGKFSKFVSDLQNDTFYEALKKFFENEYTTNKHFELDQNFLDKLTLQQMDRLASLHPKIREDKLFTGSYFQKTFNEELSLSNQEIWSHEEKRSNLLQLYTYAKSKNMPRSLQSSLLIEVLDLGIKIGTYEEALFREYLDMPLVRPYNVFNLKKKFAGDLAVAAKALTSNANAADASHWNRYICNIQQSQMPAGQVSAPTHVVWDTTQSELINKYLEQFCSEKNGSLESFKEDFDPYFLRAIEERVAIYSAEASEGLTKLQNLTGGSGGLSQSELLKKYQEVSSEVIIRFLENNQELFKVEEQVELKLQIKNVQTLYIKIFEFNTETYYKKTLQPFNTGVNLDGLVASTERVVEDFKDRPANKKYTETFTFPELDGKVGLFIVEFIGNGLSARAVIKKGSLSLIHKPTIAGHLAYVLDENKKICTGEANRTGIYFDGQYFPAHPEKGGKIFIPYGKSSLTAKAILLNNGFAQLSDFERLVETYSFSAWIHLNSESILIGNKAQILIKPNLQINQRLASLEMVQNVKVALTTTSYIDAIPVTKNFEQIVFKDTKDCVLDFQVPPYLSTISVTLKCEVQNLTQQRPQEFTVQKNFQVSTQQHTLNMCELFMKKEKNEYYIQVNGKNGEVRADVPLKVQIIHKWFKDIHREHVLTTDKEGKVKLGLLKGVMAVIVQAQTLGNIRQQWMIGNVNPHGANNLMTYPSAVDCIEGDSVEFPVAGLKKKSRKHLSLIKLWSPSQNSTSGAAGSSMIVLEDLFEKIEVVSQSDECDYGVVKLPKLADGTYKLKIKKMEKSITITVHKGQYWESDTFILKKSCLFENRAPLRMVKVQKVSISASDNNGQQKVSVNLADASANCRVHAYACHFLPTAASFAFMGLASKILESGAANKVIFPFAQWKNILMSNRELSDEFRYVFDRKYAERQLGNTLERPKLLLKRNFVQTTSISEEVMKQGTSYAQQQMQQEVQRVQQVQQRAQPMSLMNNSQPIMYQSYQPVQQQQQQYAQLSVMSNCQDIAGFNTGGYGGAYDDDAMFGYDALINAVGGSHSPESINIPEFQNFLRNTPLSLFNLAPNQQGEVTFSGNLKPYTQLYILAIDVNSVAFRQVDLAEAAVEVNSVAQKRDLSLTKPLANPQDKKGFNESRTNVNLNKGETHLIEDITSTETQLIDDLKKVQGVLEELMKLNYVGQQDGVYKTLSSLVFKWHSKSLDEKCKVYYKSVCHELNFFLSRRDKDFFTSIVQPFLACKMEKTFVDHYLLGNFKQLAATYSSHLHQLLKLNTFEMCLLIDALVQLGEVKEADRIYGLIKRDNETIGVQHDVEQQNKVFDIVLNLNMLKSSEQPAAGGAGAGAPSLDPFQPSAYPGAPAFNQFANVNQYAGFSAFDEMQQQAYAPPQHHSSMLFGAAASRSNVMPTSTTTSLNRAIGGFSGGMGRGMGGGGMANRSSRVEAVDLFDDFGGFESSQGHIQQAYNEKKKKARVDFEEIQATGEYMETHYYKQTSYDASVHLVPTNLFWLDYATYLLKGSERKHFLTANFTRNADNQVSAFLTFALLDLPLTEAESHGFKAGSEQEGGRSMEITATGNIIMFKKEVKEAPLELSNDILVTHRYIAANSPDQKSAMPDEFLLNTAYTCEVIMTNVSPVYRQFSVLYQIPQGSLPLKMTKYMKSMNRSLNPYTTEKLTFEFYFPKDGKFAHFPSNVASQEGKVIARAQQNEGQETLQVVRRLSVQRKDTFADIIQSSTRNEEVLEFLKTKNLVKGEMGFSFYLMLWMLRDKAYFKKVIEVLRERLIWDQQVWAYSFFHRDDEVACREYLQTSKPYQLLVSLGHTFKSTLLTVDLIDTEFKHLDYYPMINSRAHTVGDIKTWTLNKNLKLTYNAYLKAMIEHAATHHTKDILTLAWHKMVLVQYLQLQDRVSEAIALFKSVPAELEGDGGTSMRIQYDYMSAYFDFFNGQEEGFKVARRIVQKYEEYPILAWRIRFLEILDQLNEYDGEAEEEEQKQSLEGVDVASMTEEQRKLKLKQSMKKEPRLTFEISETDKGLLEVESANIKSIALKFYIIDAEILFSRTPFLKTNTEEFSYVKPCHVLEKDIAVDPEGDATEKKHKIPVPDHLKLQNMVIEVTGEGKQLFRTYYSTQIKVTLTEAYGELKVTEKDTSKPLPRVYVKVFAHKKGGSASAPFFFKDGYTDIRGKFDYAQTSGNRLKDVQKFAILVMSDTLGSIIKECDPPKNQESSGDSQGAGEIGGYSQQKAERIQNRVNYSKANKK